MIQLSQKDLIIIKQSQSWASRSISKLKSLTDKKYGSSLRDILDNGVVIRDLLRDMWDDLVSRETTLDSKALNTFVSLRHNFDMVRTSVVNIVVPKLEQDGIKIRDYYKKIEETTKEPKKEEPVVKTKTPDEKARYLSAVEVYITDIAASGVPEELIKKQRDALDKLNVLNEMMKKAKNDADILKIYADASEVYSSYKELVQSFMAKDIEDKSIENKASIYCGLIKNAGTIESASYYYLLALGEYGSISTRLKDVSLPVKQIIPFVREKSDIYSYRKATIQATKELLAASKEFIKGIQSAMATNDPLMKWVNVITAFNNFADAYNARITFYSGMYDALAIKGRYDKMIKSRRAPKDKKQEYSLDDFSSYDWKDLPASAQYKFKPVEKIRL